MYICIYVILMHRLAHANCIRKSCCQSTLTHWGRVTHICVSNLTVIVSDNGLSPGRRQAIIWTNAGIMLIVPLGTNFREILIEIQTFSFKKMRLKVSSAKRRPFCLGLSELKLIVNLTLQSSYDLYECLHFQLAVPAELTIFSEYLMCVFIWWIMQK